MKVLLITLRADIGGGPKHVLDLLSHAGDEVEYFVAAPGHDHFSSQYKEKSVEFLSLNHRKFNLGKLFEIIRFMKKHQIKTVHSHGRGAGIYSRLLKLFGFKIIHTFHGVHKGEGIIGKFKLVVDKFLVPLTDNFICVSNGELNEAIKYGVTRKVDTIVIPNGVNIFPFKEKKSNEPILFGTLSRLNHQKGIDILISYVEKLVKEFDMPFVIKVAGDGEEKESLENKIKLKNLNSYIQLIGSTREPQKFLNGIDIYISFARFEGMPLSVLEAVSQSCPCLLSNVVGNNDIIIDESMGYLFDLNDYNSFKKEFISIVENKSLRNEKSKEAHSFLVENFSIESMTQKTIEVYK